MTSNHVPMPGLERVIHSDDLQVTPDGAGFGIPLRKVRRCQIPLKLDAARLENSKALRCGMGATFAVRNLARVVFIRGVHKL